MRKQQHIWEKEHQKTNMLPKQSGTDPTSAVVRFVEFLQAKKYPLQGEAIDIGCGKGRNSLYLAKLGFDVYAVDYSKSALTLLENLAKKTNLEDSIHIKQYPIDKKWPFHDNFFDIAVDSFSSIDIETAEGRYVYKKELLRTLKPKSYALITVVSCEDELEKKMIKDHPGKEYNSCIWPTGKFQKDYDENELREFYKDFIIISLEKIQKPAFKLGKRYTATNYSLILQKP